MLPLLIALSAFATPTPVYGRVLTAPDAPVSGLHELQIRVYDEDSVAWETTRRVWLDDGWFSVVVDLEKGSYSVGLAVDGGAESERVRLASKRKAQPDLVVVPGLPDPVPTTDAGVPVAWVEGEPIYAADLQASLERVVPVDPHDTQPSAEQMLEALHSLIEEEMFYQAAMRSGLSHEPKVKKVLVNTLLREHVYGDVKNSDFSDEELQAYFDAHHDEFTVPEKRQIKRIFIASGEDRSAEEAREHAEGLRRQVIEDPSSFARLASEFSEDPYKRRGGDLGFVSIEGKPGIPEETINAAFRLAEGQTSEVFETDHGAEFVMVVSMRSEVARTFPQMKGSVLRKMKNDRYQELYDAYVEQLRQEAVIQIDEAALATLP